MKLEDVHGFSRYTTRAKHCHRVPAAVCDPARLAGGSTSLLMSGLWSGPEFPMAFCRKKIPKQYFEIRMYMYYRLFPDFLKRFTQEFYPIFKKYYYFYFL